MTASLAERRAARTVLPVPEPDLTPAELIARAAALKPLAISLPDGPHSAIGVTRAALAPSFVRPGEEPWVVAEGNWWKLNPKRPDFHPRSGGGILSGRGDAKNQPSTDLEGKRRTKPDIGAYAG